MIKKYSINVKQRRVPVTYDIYKAYHKEREYARYLEKKARANEISLQWLDEHGVCPKYADISPSPLDFIIHQQDLAKLKAALCTLQKDEQKLIHALYFENKSERQISIMFGISQKGVNKRKRKILAKLKKEIDI